MAEMVITARSNRRKGDAYTDIYIARFDQNVGRVVVIIIIVIVIKPNRF